MSCQIKKYLVTVRGFPPVSFLAVSRGKATAKAWRAYTSYDEACGFRRFLEISRVERAAEPKGFGREIRVAGEKAHWLGFDGQYVIFCRPGEAETFFSHPLDVEELTSEAAE